MKKIFLLICLLLLVFLLPSCGHNHEKAENLLANDTHHWYPCADEDCDAVLEKVEHSWGNGEITTKPTPSKAGVRSYLCTVCKRLKQESVEYESLHSVDATQWKKAFAFSNFSDVTATIEEIRLVNNTEYKTVYTIQSKGSILYVVCIGYENGQEKSYIAKLQDGNFVWSFTDKNQKVEELNPELTAEPMDGFAILSDNGFDRLKDFYGSFSYNSKTGCYDANGMSFENGFGYTSVSVEMQDGMISSITAVTDESTPTEIKVSCSSYGTTKPTPPTTEQSK